MLPYYGLTMTSRSRKPGMDNRKQFQKDEDNQRQCQLNSFNSSDKWVHCMGSLECNIENICPTTGSRCPKISKRKSAIPEIDPIFSVSAFFHREAPLTGSNIFREAPICFHDCPNFSAYRRFHSKTHRCQIWVYFPWRNPIDFPRY